MSNHYYMLLPRQEGSIITSIRGKRCTAVRRSTPQTTAADSAKQATTQQAPAKTTAPAQGDSASPTQAQQIVAPVTSATDSTSGKITNIAFPQTSDSSSDLTTPIADSQTGPVETSSPVRASGQQGNGLNSNLFETSTRPSRPTGTVNGNDPSKTGDTTLVSPPERGPAEKGAIVGGVMGVFVVVAIISILLFFCRRRRRRREQLETLPSPRGSASREKFYEIDSGSLGPSKKTTKWKREISARAENAAYGLKTAMYDVSDMLRDTVTRDRSYSPSLVSNTGVTQRYQESIGTHSRNNSVLTASSRRSSLREQLAKWRGRFGEVWQPQKLGAEVRHPLTRASTVRDSQSESILRYRDSGQSGSVTTSNLGLTLMNSQTSDLLKMENQPRDPFEDPYGYEDPFCDPKIEPLMPTKSSDRPLSHPFPTSGENPFSDSIITAPSTTVLKPQTYIQHVRRSRGSSFSSGAPSSNRSSRNSDLISFADRPTSMTMTSPRFPSSVALSQHSNRSTIYSTFSAERRGKGRSDPFDLERADIYSHLSPKNRPKEPCMQSPTSITSSGSRIRSMIEEEKKRGHHKYHSNIRYSSGVDSLEDWGDPDEAEEDSAVGANGDRKRELGSNDAWHARADSEAVIDEKGIYSNHKINGSLTEIKITLSENQGS